MVIQRIQTLLLLMAAIVVAALCFVVPIGMDAANAGAPHDLVYVMHSPSLLVLGIIIMVLLLLDIFLYKNLKLQIRVAGICFLLLVALCCDGAFVMCARLPEGYAAMWIGPVLVWIAAAVLTLYARARMKSDLALLKSYDRIR